MNSDNILRYAAVLLAIAQPFILLFLFGEQRSISMYWNTTAQPLFIVTNAMTSYFLFSVKHWKPTALFLLLLTAFSVSLYPMLHNTFAISFFIYSAISMYQLHRFRIYLIPYVLSGIWTIHHMLYGEIAAILIICAYHVHILIYLEILKKKIQ